MTRAAKPQPNATALAGFFAWREEQGRPPFTHAAVQAHRAWLEQQGYSPSTINQRLAAIRKLARQAAQRAARRRGRRRDRPEPRHQATGRQGGELADPGNRPRRSSTSPIRRPSKATRPHCPRSAPLRAAGVEVRDLKQRDGRWVIPDLRGKHGRLRTVPAPAWVKTAVDAWTAAAGITDGRLLRAMNRHGAVTGASISGTAILDLVRSYGARLGLKLQAHDARRTCAKLCRASGGDLEQIQLLLGHSSIQTTERYLGTRQDLVEAPNDRIRLRWDTPK